MEFYIKEIPKIMLDKVKERYYGLMVQHLKVNLDREKSKEKHLYKYLLKAHIKDRL